MILTVILLLSVMISYSVKALYSSKISIRVLYEILRVYDVCSAGKQLFACRRTVVVLPDWANTRRTQGRH